MVQYDEADSRLLRMLQKDASISQAALADAVGISTASCWRRLKSMEESGIMGPLVRLVDPDKVGLTLYVVCQVRMRSHDHEARRVFEEYIERLDYVMECYSISGEWDYLLHIVVRSVAAYEELLMQGLLRQPSVATSASHFSLRRIKYKTSLPV